MIWRTFLGALIAALTVLAQSTTYEDPYGRSTPRGSLLGLLRAVNNDDFTHAARYLDTGLSGAKSSELAEQLGIVLNRRFREQVDRISDEAGGSRSDSDDPLVERIGSVDGPNGQVSIVLRRSQPAGQAPVWLFSAGTLANIPGVYADLEGNWFEKNLPDFLTRTRVLRVPLWRWLLVLLSIPLAFIFASACGRLASAALPALLGRFRFPAADAKAFEIGGPFRVLSFALFVYAQSWISLTVVGRSFYQTLAGILSVIGFTWLGMRILDGLFAVYGHRHAMVAGSDLAVRRLMQRLLKIVILIGGLIALLQTFGRNPTTLLAGLGVGGIAIAFAAQKTLENLFGGIMMISDQPIRVGDLCKVGDVEGTVEDIGLRSTRIRTPARTMVSIPNGQISATGIENFGARDKFLLQHTLGLRYETTASQLRAVLEGIRQEFRNNEVVETESARVRFIAFSSSSLDVEAFAYIQAKDFVKFLSIQEELLLRFMDIVEQAGSGFAFPSQTFYIRREPVSQAQTSQAGKTPDEIPTSAR